MTIQDNINNNKFSYERAKWCIDQINSSVDLTEWEEDFMSSVTNQFNKSGQLSDKQMAVIERIYKRI